MLAASALAGLSADQVRYVDDATVERGLALVDAPDSDAVSMPTGRSPTAL